MGREVITLAGPEIGGVFQIIDGQMTREMNQPQCSGIQQPIIGGQMTGEINACGKGGDYAGRRGVRKKVGVSYVSTRSRWDMDLMQGGYVS